MQHVDQEVDILDAELQFLLSKKRERIRNKWKK
jgi:hypothetical protein